MKTTDTQTRQSLRCAYAPRIAESHPWLPDGYPGDEPATCPIYTTGLPEVTEVAEARFYLRNGSLSLLVGGELQDGLRDGIAIMEGAENAAAHWAAENPVKQ